MMKKKKERKKLKFTPFMVMLLKLSVLNAIDAMIEQRGNKKRKK